MIAACGSSTRVPDLTLARVLSWLALLARSEATKDVEILVLVGAEYRVTSPDQRLRSLSNPAVAHRRCPAHGEEAGRDDLVQYRG
jgi:hypothetical protein